MDKEKLYEAIDNDDELTDSEKRDAYFGEIENQEAEERWQEEQDGF